MLLTRAKQPCFAKRDVATYIDLEVNVYNGTRWNLELEL